jgi:hypothetical protein
LGLIRGRQRQDLNRFDCGGRFRCLTTGAAKASKAVLALPAGGLSDAEIGGQQGATQLIAEGGVSARQATSDRITQAQGVPRDMECVEAMMVEGARRALHVDLSAQNDALLRGQIQIISIT